MLDKFFYKLTRLVRSIITSEPDAKEGHIILSSLMTKSELTQAMVMRESRYDYSFSLHELGLVHLVEPKGIVFTYIVAPSTLRE